MFSPAGAHNLSRAIPEGLAALLEEEIIFGRLPPSMRLTEEEVALRYGVSRSPVREALRLLERDGLVLREARRGIWVAPLSIKDFDEVYACRIELEGLAAEGAARSQDRARKKQFAGLLAKLQDAAARGDAQEFFVVDVQGSALTYDARRQQDTETAAGRAREAGAALPLPRLFAQPEDRRPVARGHRPHLRRHRRRRCSRCKGDDREPHPRDLAGHARRLLADLRRGAAMLNVAASFSVIDSPHRRTPDAGHPQRHLRLEGRQRPGTREDFRARFDSLRPLLLHEPRGHAAMVGLVPVLLDGRRLRRLLHILLCLSRHVRPRHDRLRQDAGLDRPDRTRARRQLHPGNARRRRHRGPDMGRGRHPLGGPHAQCAELRRRLPISPSSSRASAP